MRLATVYAGGATRFEAGDVLEVEVSGIGTLRNTVIDE